MKRALLLLLIACGRPEVEPDPEKPMPMDPPAHQGPLTGLPCDVQAALQANCASCHAGQTYAPHLATREQLVETGKKLTERMLDIDRPMPPVHAERQPSITERAVIWRWVEQGMPGGDCGGLSP